MSYNAEKELSFKRFQALTQLVCAAISKEGMALELTSMGRIDHRARIFDECYLYMRSIEQSVLLEDFLDGEIKDGINEPS